MHELKCAGCGERLVSFVPVRNEQTGRIEYAPHRCVCGHLMIDETIPPGELVDDAGRSGVKRWLAGRGNSN